jgi:hypothetical protein
MSLEMVPEEREAGLEVVEQAVELGLVAGVEDLLEAGSGLEAQLQEVPAHDDGYGLGALDV